MIPLTLKELTEIVRGRVAGPPRDVLVKGVTTDSRRVRPGDVFFAIPGARFDGHDFVAAALQAGAVAAVVSQTRQPPASPVPPDALVRVEDTVQALADLARWNRRRLRATVVAVTGSNGKTTTKDMIHHILAADRTGHVAPKSFNNDIGLPVTLLAGGPDDDYLIAEIGSNGPGQVRRLAQIAEPDIAVITSVSATHLEGLGDERGVAAEKLSLLHHVRDGGLAAVNIDSAVVRELLGPRSDCTVVTFGLSDEADLRANEIRTTNQGVAFKLNGRFDVHLAIPGRHNAVNALAAIAVARRMGLGHERIIERLATFRLPPMRLERMRVGAIEIINDAYNANPASMHAAIEVLGASPARGRRVLVAGDMRELGRAATRLHRQLGQTIARSPVDVLVAVGDHAGHIMAGAKAASDRLVSYGFADVRHAARKLARILQPGDLVLIKGSRALGLERLVDTLRETAKPLRKPGVRGADEPHTAGPDVSGA